MVCCIIFFGSLAIAASRPLPPIDREALLGEGLLNEYNSEVLGDSGYVYSVSSAQEVGGLAS
jgi:hypothetical protein